MSDEVEFKSWGKIPRINAGLSISITEKMDGTNSCVIVQDNVVVGVQSRNRLITPDDDNYGFATWVEENKDKLALLGNGYHYGEWAGLGINGNRHHLDSKRFYLFNTDKNGMPYLTEKTGCFVVSKLFDGVLLENTIGDIMSTLNLSRPYSPEGIIIWFYETRSYAKCTYKFSEGKWKG